MRANLKRLRQRQKKSTSVLVSVKDGAANSWSLDTTAWIAILYFFSGIPALVYQTVWQRLLVLHSGVGTASVAIIVAAYMLGLGTGSLLGGWISRNRSPRTSLAWFACLELAVAAYAYGSPFLLYSVLYQKFGWLYDDLWTAALLHVATLVFPTTLMGMTLPILTSALSQLESITPRGISLIYGCNALGAATGALLTPWLLMPYVGVEGSCAIGATINFAVALVALRRYRNTADLDSKESKARILPINQLPSPQKVLHRGRFAAWMAIYFLSGFVAIGLEILWFRILDISVKSSSFLFGTLLFTFLGCLALGSLFGAVRVKAIFDPLTTYLRAQCAIIVSALVPLLLLVYLPEWIWRETWLFQYWNQPTPFVPSFGQIWTTLVLYAVLPLCVMGPATFGMGYTFTALQLGVHADAKDTSFRVGILQAANILGCLLGSLAVGLWWLGDFGTPLSLRAIAILGASFALIGLCVTKHRAQFSLLLTAIVLMAWCVPGDNSLWFKLHGQTSDSKMLIVEDVSGVAAVAPEVDSPQWRVSANGKSQSSLPFRGFHCKLGALPATLHPDPKAIAIIGLGSGSTAWAAACRTQSQAITVFEVCTAEEPVLKLLAATGEHDQLRRFLFDPRIHIVGRDARHSLMTASESYDVIETDAIRPNTAYAGYLYSLEFFELCRSRLKPGGIMCCWSPTSGTFSTFRKAFPYMLSLDGGLLLIGSTSPIELDRLVWKSNVSHPEVASYLGQEVVSECLTSIDGCEALVEQLSIPLINTDLFPYDEFH